MEASARILHPKTYLILSTLVHIFGFIATTGAAAWHTTYLVMNAKRTIFNTYGFSVKYSVFWGLLFQMFHHALGIVADVMALINVQKESPVNLLKVMSYSRVALVFPTSVFHFLLFWLLNILDFGKNGPEFLTELPILLRLLIYMVPFLFTFLDYITFRLFSPKDVIGLPIVAVAFFLYSAMLFIIHALTGTWVYPLIRYFGVYERLIFFLAMLVLHLLFYLWGKFLNNVLWDEEFASKLMPHWIKYEPTREEDVDPDLKNVAKSPSPEKKKKGGLFGSKKKPAKGTTGLSSFELEQWNAAPS